MCSKVISFEKSFASFEEIDKVKSWNYELNIGLIPENVFKHSNKKYYFDCYICKHTFHSILNGITSKNRGWCPYCTKPCKKLCNNNKCIFCFNNSFDSFDKEKVNCWNYEKNNSLPRDLFKATNTKYYFTCNKCDHEFKIALHHVTVNNKWCPYCAISCKKLCTNIDCDICFNKSFASFDSEKVNCWNYEKNKFNPRYVSKYSDKICWFICNNKHEFKKKLKHIAFDNRWCPHCKNKYKRRNTSSIDGIVMWQYAKHAFTNAEVFLVCFPFIITFALTANFTTLNTKRSFTESKLGKAALQSTRTFNCCSKLFPKSINAINRHSKSDICLRSSSTDKESSES